VLLTLLVLLVLLVFLVFRVVTFVVAALVVVMSVVAVGVIVTVGFASFYVAALRVATVLRVLTAFRVVRALRVVTVLRLGTIRVELVRPLRPAMRFFLRTLGFRAQPLGGRGLLLGLGTLPASLRGLLFGLGLAPFSVPTDLGGFLARRFGFLPALFEPLLLTCAIRRRHHQADHGEQHDDRDDENDRVRFHQISTLVEIAIRGSYPCTAGSCATRAFVSLRTARAQHGMPSQTEKGSQVETGRIQTNIPGRLDRLPWSRWHWIVVLGLGTVWILDGVEVTIVGSLSDALKPGDTGLGLSNFQVGLAGASYVAGACLGSLVFGQLTDRFGRKRLFMVTLAVYLAGTVLTAFSPNPLWYFACRFITGTGIGGEYAAINSAVDELIPAKYRGRVDVAINGSFWMGAALGGLLTVPLLSPNVMPEDLGWRFAFGFGAILGVGILLVRRSVPESPRWLFIHGREEAAERVVRSIEQQVADSTGTGLAEVSETLTIRQRRTIGLGLIARTVFTMYPRRTLLCLALFIGQAFLYNAFFFTFGDVLTTFYGVDGGKVGFYIAGFAVSNFLGAIVLSPLFDTIGRVRMISGTYLLAGVLLIGTGLLLHSFTGLTLTLAGAVVFFFASAGASSAYLTASEIFPLETRALCIAFFYAVGTAAGGIAGPLLFGGLIDAGAADRDVSPVMLGYLIGGACMLAGGIVEAFLGVRAEQRSLEDIAKPLTAE
jgi:MFS family permease